MSDISIGIDRQIRCTSRNSVWQGCAAGAILQCAVESGADFVAMETHGRGGMSRLLLGSVADKVVRGSRVPALLHRACMEKTDGG
jgi:nucleotide-binding universal stress UspA family protein